MLTCPYTGNKYNDEDLSKDHIIPLALGGSNQFVIKSSKEANNDIGTQIEGKISSDFFLSSYIYFLEVKNRVGKSRPWKIKDSKIQGVPAHVQFAINGDMTIHSGGAKSEDVCLKTGEKTISLTFFDKSPEEVKKLEESVKNRYGERLKNIKTEIVKIELPEIEGSITLDLLLHYRLFAKIALGASVYLWSFYNKDYLETDESKIFQNILWMSVVSDWKQLQSVGQVFPNCQVPAELARFILIENKHTLLFFNTDQGTVLWINLFGSISGQFIVAQKNAVPDIGEGKIFVLDPVTRSCEFFDFPDFLKKLCHL